MNPKTIDELKSIALVATILFHFYTYLECCDRHQICDLLISDLINVIMKYVLPKRLLYKDSLEVIDFIRKSNIFHLRKSNVQLNLTFILYNYYLKMKSVLTSKAHRKTKK